MNPGPDGAWDEVLYNKVEYIIVELDNEEGFFFFFFFFFFFPPTHPKQSQRLPSNMTVDPPASGLIIAFTTCPAPPP